MEEIFKVYKESNGKKCGHRIYEVSNLGRLKINGELVEPFIHNQYYYNGGFYIHRAVAELFIPNPDNKPCIDHINTDKLDNRTDNLRWVTVSENGLNPLTRKKLSNSLKGRKGTMSGKKHSAEAKEKIRESITLWWSNKS